MELVEKMGSSLGQFFRGLKRSTAQQQGKGEGGKIQVGQYDRQVLIFYFHHLTNTGLLTLDTRRLLTLCCPMTPKLSLSCSGGD